MSEIILYVALLLILLQTSYLAWRSIRPTIGRKARTILVDTSVLMDGRIVEIAETGFIGGTLLIPRSVLGEMQLLADGSSSEKRGRARAGLDLVARLQQIESISVQIYHDNRDAREGVDNRLLKLARTTGSSLCTLDFNLSKVAVVEGVEVLNINTLAQSVRAAHLPGDRLKLDLVQKGQESGQAIGYLPDGTMVVVDQAASQVGSEVEIEVIRSLQTAAGRMMFAKRTATNKPQAKRSDKNHSPKHQPDEKSIKDQTPKPATVKVSQPKPKPANVKNSQPKPKPARSSDTHKPRKPHHRSSGAAESSLVKLANR